jgi:aminoglycoside phosphotransferase (APT) family kinase protein
MIEAVVDRISDFVVSELGCPPSRVVQLDAFPGNAVYEVDADGRALIVKASTNHGALRAEAWACARGAAAGCAAPAILRFGRLDTGMSAMILSRVAGRPIAAEDPTLIEVGADLRRLHSVTMTGFGWLAEASWDASGDLSLTHPSWPSFLRAICDDTRELANSYGFAAVVADATESAIDHHAGTLDAIEPVLCHGDLKAAHILVDAGRLAGAIDWGDALAADPWWDIARFAHRSPEASLALLLRGYRPAGEQAWRLPLYEALWMLVDACIAHRHGHRVDATLRGAMNYLSART